MKPSRQISAFLFSQRESSLFGREEEEEEEEGRVLPLTSLHHPSYDRAAERETDLGKERHSLGKGRDLGGAQK